MQSNLNEKQAEIGLMPYVEINGTRTVSDDDMEKFFQRIQQDGSANIVFYGDKIKTAKDFISFMKDTKNFPTIITVDGLISGIVWLNGISKNYAFGHFCLLRNTWGEHTLHIGQKVLDYWFSINDKHGDPVLDVIIGIVPSFNTKALKFIERLGFKRVGEIPKMVKDDMGNQHSSVISYYER